MRHERLIVLAVAAALLGACASMDEWNARKRRNDATPAALTDDGQVVAAYLATLDQLGKSGTTEQAEIIDATRGAYLADPSAQKRLHYAFMLAVPGHAASDAVGARALIGEALATSETLLPSERALAELIARDLDARLALTRENEALRNGNDSTDRNRIADLNRRLQQESAEKDRLRRELERAEAKLEAIATLEGTAEPRR